MPEIYVNQLTLTSALGVGMDAVRQRLQDGTSGLAPSRWPGCEVPCYIGAVDLAAAPEVPPALESRNNRLMALALRQDNFERAVREAIERVGPHRVGIVMGTSTSSIDRTEDGFTRLHDGDRFPEAYRQPNTHNPHGTGSFVASYFGLGGPCLTVSTACSSSAKVFGVAKRWLQQDLVDVVVAGGADSLCLSVLYGFHSLQLVAPDPCRPFSPDRSGISLGEAAGFTLLSRERTGVAVRLAGVGESCDAYHMSSAHPEGLGARLSMERALEDAAMTWKDVDYVNLHGTGTRANDEIEGRVCDELLDERTCASATKGWTGHTLGAAGIVEAVLAIESMRTGWVPGTQHTKASIARFDLLLENERRDVQVALSNSFGFGGNNCSVVFAA